MAKVCAEVFAHLHAVNVKHHTGIDCLVYQDKFSVHNPLDIKENDEHAPDRALHLSHFFSDFMSFDLSSQIEFSFLEHLNNHCRGLRHAFSEIRTKFDVVLLSDPSQNHISK
jgi:hypothetical protein